MQPKLTNRVSSRDKLILGLSFGFLVVVLLTIGLAAFTGVYHVGVALGLTFVYAVMVLLVLVFLAAAVGRNG